jgi:hypothetical protein
MSRFPVLVAALVLGLWAAPALAAGPAYVLILDATAGMGRLETAKPALSAVVRDLPDNAQAALYLYPKPTAEACLPVQELAPLGPLDKPAFLRAIAGLRPPDGRPPRSLDLEAATRTILSVRVPVTAVLLSTGLETCDGDACGVASMLKALGVPFTLKVIGYQVTPNQAAQLQCMADSTGGVFETAANASDLTQALRRAFQVHTLQVQLQRQGRALDGRVEVAPAGTGKPLAGMRTGPTGLAAFSLPPGTYDVTALDPASPGEQRITFFGVVLEPGKAARRTAEFSGAEVRVSVTRNGKPCEALVELKALDRSGLTIQVRGGVPAATLHAMPGIYDLRVRDPADPARPPCLVPGVAVRGGRVNELAAALDDARLAVRASRQGLPCDAQVEIFAPDQAAPVASGRSGAENPVAYALPPGVYEVRVTDPQSRKSARLTKVPAQAGQTAFVDALLD